ncbi:hypothetical protein [Arsenophonus endosymbiont of Aleurodicus floccissimus]|uniref:hypothetical protein n=1 Tax=Arsenophonus endosymbiont of Aleurodicus floccissimus TaxID=2152761 RepID=UPI001EE04615|nr:hypothetical protein [Arsenophonus endosymbiont of Aleurodicus floccissimus]
MKAPIDALYHWGLIVDDSQIDVLHVERREIVKGGKLIITILGNHIIKKPSLNIQRRALRSCSYSYFLPEGR